MICRHRYFFGVSDPDLGCFRSNMRMLETKLRGNFYVRCEHCGEAIAGEISDSSDPVEVIWRHDGDNFFGKFTALVEGAA